MKKKIVAMMIVGMLAVSMAACGGTEVPAEESATESTEKPDEPQEDKEEEQKINESSESNTASETEESNKVPSIKGSQAYDIILNLEDTGIPKADAVSNSDGFQFDSSTAQYSYSISTNSKHEIMSAQFFVLTGTDSEGFLGFCASMPYDSSSPDAQQWVNDNAGSEAETTFGDAIYTLSVGTQGPILTIKATGYDEYIMNTLMGE